MLGNLSKVDGPISAQLPCSTMEIMARGIAVSRTKVTSVIVGHGHCFILDISIAPFQVHYYTEALPTTALILCRS